MTVETNFFICSGLFSVEFLCDMFALLCINFRYYYKSVKKKTPSK